jgi:hypothetical protein
MRIILLHRFDYSAVNPLEYQYGPGFYTSLIGGKAIAEILTCMLEIRHEYRRRDRYEGRKLADTGGSVFIASPQLNLVLGGINVSVLFEYPFYRYYNGRQLASDYAFALNIAWQPHLFGD